MLWKKWFFGVAAFLIMIFSAWGPVSPAWALEAVLFEMEDPSGDDFGPGTYRYPTGAIFAPQKGLLDLIKFKVTADNKFYYFDTTMARISNPWGAPEGFSHPIINIYIDAYPNEGKTETFREGAYVDFDLDHGWEYFIKVTGWKKTALYGYKDLTGAPGLKKDIETRLLEDGKTIRVKVPQAYLANPENWYYYVLVGSLDGAGPDNFRPVMAQTSLWQLGGGTNTNYDPNVIDLLAPEKGAKTQQAQLGSYSLKNGTLAVISPVAAEPQQLAGALKKLGKLARIEDGIKGFFMPFFNKYSPSRYYPVYIAGGLAMGIVLLLGWVNFGKYFKNS
ncbi:MAG: hypothetical protein M0T74_04675 [Desulfitobacterium hafniense]|nr:hypothetical protein [Desulfitobacterium hafniense]